METNKPQSKLLVIVGPTASGKSALALKLAKKFNGEIVAADSRTIYKGMDIGTAKPGALARNRVPHHMLDLLEPSQQFSAAEFKRRANQAIADIQARSKLPMLVGGSGLYIDSVIFDFKFGPMATKQWHKKLESWSINKLLHHAAEHGISLGGIEPANKRHIVRAIERGGMLEQRLELRSNTLVVGLNLPQAELKQRIIKRVNEMIEQGFINEALKLAENHGWETEAASVYKVVRDYERGNKTLTELKQELINKHSQLAKRQRTWFKRNPFIQWYDSSKAAEQAIKAWLNT